MGMAVFGDNLKKLREQSGFTQQQVAHIIGCANRQDVSRHERGQLPRVDVAMRLGSAYGVSVEKLYPDLQRRIQDETVERIAAVACRREVCVSSPDETTILAIYPSVHRIGVAVFAVPRLVSTAVRKLRSTAVPLERLQQWTHIVAELVRTYRADVIVVEKLPDRGSRHNTALLAFIKILKQLARRQGIAVVEYTTTYVRESLVPPGLPTTNAVLFRLVAGHFVELRDYLPRVQRAIDEGPRHFASMFLATALGWMWMREHGMSGGLAA